MSSSVLQARILSKTRCSMLTNFLWTGTQYA